MDYKRVIVDSWRSTQKSKSLIVWFGFLPALFTTTVGILYMAYQFFAFKKSYLFEDAEDSFFHDVVLFIWDFVKANVSLTLPLVIFVVIFAVLYFLLPTIARASAIQAIARRKNGQNAGAGTGLRHGIMSFLPLFEYHLLIKTFAFFSVLFEMSFVLRNLGPVIFEMFLPVFILFLIISFILTLLFTYTDFFIVIDDFGIFKSMQKSAKLVIMNWKHTVLITILMIIIGIRVIIQAILVLLVPSLIVLITGYITTIALPATSVIIGGIFGIIALLVAAYLNGIVDIFSYTVWTYTFLELSSEKEISARDVLIDDIGEKSHDYHGHKNLEN
ncbi:MAG: hypothetical protein GWP15_00565 [Nitrospirae bacterium]|nr:hypothetical protein [Nitrospirota bacterium]